MFWAVLVVGSGLQPHVAVIYVHWRGGEVFTITALQVVDMGLITDCCMMTICCFGKKPLLNAKPLPFTSALFSR